MGRVSDYLRSYPTRLWHRLPVIFAVVGLALLGFGRRVTEWQAAGGELPAGSHTYGIGLIAVSILLFVFQRYRTSSQSSSDIAAAATNMSDEDLKFDFTNEEVQEVLQTDDDLNIDEWAEDDLAQVIYDGDDESHYAVLDIWWSQIARGLGYEIPEEDDGGAYLVSLALTSAYQNHADRVGEHPTIESEICGTSPFVAEH